MTAPFFVGRPSWKIRRRIVIATLLWCAISVTYLMIFGRPISLSETIANGLLLLMASVIGSYVFGAVWDDKNNPPAATTEIYKKTVVPPGGEDPTPPEGYAP